MPQRNGHAAGARDPDKSLPSHLVHCNPVHVRREASLLSGRKQHGRLAQTATEVSFKGFKHLALIVLVTTYIRSLVLDSLRFGFLQTIRQAGVFVPEIPLALKLLLWTFLYVPIALALEQFAARTAAKLVAANTKYSKLSSLLLALISVAQMANALACLASISWCCYYYIRHPFVGTIVEAAAIVTFLKLTSFSLTNRDLRRSFLARGPDLYGPLRYPRNLTFSNILYFWIAPTLVYQPTYPHTERVQWGLVVSLVAEMVVASVALWLMSMHMAVPILDHALKHYGQRQYVQLADDVLGLSSVNIVIWLVGFFLLFQSFLNLVAEVSRFGDRQFYLDWWNAGSEGAYWRDWNKPVNNYCRRHIYIPLRRRGWSKLAAGNTVFFVSGVLHELLVGVPTHSMNGVAFLCMMAQSPLVYMTEPLEHMHGHGATVGNCIFWISILFGQPTAIIIYYLSWRLRQGADP